MSVSTVTSINVSSPFSSAASSLYSKIYLSVQQDVIPSSLNSQNSYASTDFACSSRVNLTQSCSVSSLPPCGSSLSSKANSEIKICLNEEINAYNCLRGELYLSTNEYNSIISFLRPNFSLMEIPQEQIGVYSNGRGGFGYTTSKRQAQEFQALTFVNRSFKAATSFEEGKGRRQRHNSAKECLNGFNVKANVSMSDAFRNVSTINSYEDFSKNTEDSLLSANKFSKPTLEVGEDEMKFAKEESTEQFQYNVRDASTKLMYTSPGSKNVENFAVGDHSNADFLSVSGVPQDDGGRKYSFDLLQVHDCKGYAAVGGKVQKGDVCTADNNTQARKYKKTKKEVATSFQGKGEGVESKNVGGKYGEGICEKKFKTYNHKEGNKNSFPFSGNHKLCNTALQRGSAKESVANLYSRVEGRINSNKSAKHSNAVVNRNNRSKSWLHKCYNILNHLRKKTAAKWFLVPVEPQLDGVPDYFDVIDTPMDFSTIEKKLNQGVYTSFFFFQLDVRQIFFNAFTYHNHENEVWKDAYELARDFDSSVINISLEKHCYYSSKKLSYRILSSQNVADPVPLTRSSPQNFSSRGRSTTHYNGNVSSSFASREEVSEKNYANCNINMMKIHNYSEPSICSPALPVEKALLPRSVTLDLETYNALLLQAQRAKQSKKAACNDHLFMLRKSDKHSSLSAKAEKGGKARTKIKGYKKRQGRKKLASSLHMENSCYYDDQALIGGVGGGAAVCSVDSVKKRNKRKRMNEKAIGGGGIGGGGVIGGGGGGGDSKQGRRRKKKKFKGEQVGSEKNDFQKYYNNEEMAEENFSMQNNDYSCFPVSEFRRTAGERGVNRNGGSSFLSESGAGGDVAVDLSNYELPPEMGPVPLPPHVGRIGINDKSLSKGQRRTLQTHMSKLAVNQRLAVLQLIQDDLAILPEDHCEDINFFFDVELLSIEKQKQILSYVNQMIRLNREKLAALQLNTRGSMHLVDREFGGVMNNSYYGNEEEAAGWCDEGRLKDANGEYSSQVSVVEFGGNQRYVKDVEKRYRRDVSGKGKLEIGAKGGSSDVDSCDPEDNDNNNNNNSSSSFSESSSSSSSDDSDEGDSDDSKSDQNTSSNFSCAFQKGGKSEVSARGGDIAGDFSCGGDVGGGKGKTRRPCSSKEEEVTSEVMQSAQIASSPQYMNKNAFSEKEQNEKSNHYYIENNENNHHQNNHHQNNHHQNNNNNNINDNINNNINNVKNMHDKQNEAEMRKMSMMDSSVNNLNNVESTIKYKHMKSYAPTSAVAEERANTEENTFGVQKVDNVSVNKNCNIVETNGKRKAKERRTKDEEYDKALKEKANYFFKKNNNVGLNVKTDHY